MKFWQALKAFEEGKPIRCIEWSRNTFVAKNIHSGVEWMDYTRWEDCLRKEWELYEEPKPSRLEVAEKSYAQICTAIDNLKNLGVEVGYPEEIRVDGECFLFSAKEPKKLLSFVEVVKGMKEGKKFKRLTMCGYLGEEHLPTVTFRIEDFETADWIEVK